MLTSDKNTTDCRRRRYSHSCVWYNIRGILETSREYHPTAVCVYARRGAS